MSHTALLSVRKPIGDKYSRDKAFQDWLAKQGPLAKEAPDVIGDAFKDAMRADPNLMKPYRVNPIPGVDGPNGPDSEAVIEALAEAVVAELVVQQFRTENAVVLASHEEGKPASDELRDARRQDGDNLKAAEEAEQKYGEAVGVQDGVALEQAAPGLQKAGSLGSLLPAVDAAPALQDAGGGGG